MKYICTNPFPNPQGKPIVIADLKDESGKVTLKQSHVTLNEVVRTDHIHKGAIFNIGTATEFKDLSPAEKFLVSQLAGSTKKIEEATPQTIDRVNKEVAHEKALVERDAARDKKADPNTAIMETLKTLTEAVTALTAAVNKPAK